MDALGCSLVLKALLSVSLQGFVISDWQGIDRITNPPHLNYSYSVYAGISAGIDMVSLRSDSASHLFVIHSIWLLDCCVCLSVMQIMVPYNYTEFIDEINSQIKSNLIPMSRIDDAVKRILRVKFTMGLFEEPLADLTFANQLGSKVRSLFYPPLLLIISYGTEQKHF